MDSLQPLTKTSRGIMQTPRAVFVPFALLVCLGLKDGRAAYDAQATPQARMANPRGAMGSGDAMSFGPMPPPAMPQATQTRLNDRAGYQSQPVSRGSQGFGDDDGMTPNMSPPMTPPTMREGLSDDASTDAGMADDGGANDSLMDPAMTFGNSPRDAQMMGSAGKGDDPSTMMDNDTGLGGSPLDRGQDAALPERDDSPMGNDAFGASAPEGPQDEPFGAPQDRANANSDPFLGNVGTPSAPEGSMRQAPAWPSRDEQAMPGNVRGMPQGPGSF